MKAKQLEKKLVLNKETIADLNKEEMNFVYGGFSEESICLCTRASDCETIPKRQCTNQQC
jgi:natural product precursor